MLIKSFRDIVRHWSRNYISQIATLTVLIGTFSAFSMAMLIHQNLDTFLSRWGNDVKANIYLTEDITTDQTLQIQKAIEKSRLFESTRYLTKEDAAKKFRERVGELVPDLLSDVDFQNPLPASFELQIRGGLDSKSAFNDLVNWAKSIRSLMGVDEVSYGQGWVENYSSVVEVFKVGSWSFLLIIFIGSLFIIGNSVRSAVEQKRDEIVVLELFGASRNYIIIPFVIEGLLTGFVAGVISVIVVFALFHWQVDYLLNELRFFNFRNKIDFLNFGRIFIVILTSSALGATAAFIWSSQIASGWAAAEANE